VKIFTIQLTWLVLILHQYTVKAILVAFAPMSTPVRNSVSDRMRSEGSQGEELLANPRRLLGPSLSTDIVLSEETQEEAHVQEPIALQLEGVCAIEECKFPEFKSSLGYALDTNKKILTVTQHHLANHPPPLWYVSRLQVTVQEEGSCKVHILMRDLENGILQDES